MTSPRCAAGEGEGRAVISFDSVFKRVCVCAVDVATLKSVRT